MSGRILCVREDAIATITLSNPGKLNAIDFAMWQKLAEVLREVSGDEQVRCVVLRGDGEQAFAAGGDIEEFLHRRDTLERALAYHAQVGAALQAVFDCRHPTIALLQGACIGGGLEIAAQCDLRVCGESSRFGAPINKLGFSMYPGEMAGLLRLAGAATVFEILLEGRILGAAEARFAEYEAQIRREYNWVPGWLFRRKRKAILREFLARAPLYGTACFHDRLEAQARRNLARAIGVVA